MIWNSAADVRFNGSSVNAVICNSEVIWPLDQADSWTCLCITANSSAFSGGSEFAVSIFDGRNRKIFTTDGLKPISSFDRTGNIIMFSASGVSPYRFTFSGSGEPYHILNLHAYSSYYTAKPYVHRSTLSTSTPGSFISGTGTLRDSLLVGFDSATNNIQVYDYKKILQVSGVAKGQSSNTASLSSNQAFSMLFFVPTRPSTGVLSASNGGTNTPWSSQVAIPNYTNTGAVTGGLRTFEYSLYNSTRENAFDLFNSVTHTGDVGIQTKSALINGSNVSSNNVAYASWFPSTILSANQNMYYLSGGRNLNPTSVAKGTRSGNGIGLALSAQFSNDDPRAYLGLYSMTTTNSAVSSESIKCKLSSIPYTASAQVR